MVLSILNGQFAVCRLKPGATLPRPPNHPDFYSVTVTRDEISIVCSEEDISSYESAERDWKMIKIQGPLDFGMTGVLSSIAAPLAHSSISIFAVSTFDTDYILVKQDKIDLAQQVLTEQGFQFR